MILFILFIVLLSIFEIMRLKKEKLKKEIIIYSVLACFTLALGIVYNLTTDRINLAGYLLKLFRFGK